MQTGAVDLDDRSQGTGIGLALTEEIEARREPSIVQALTHSQCLGQRPAADVSFGSAICEVLHRLDGSHPPLER